jgi:uncharacterized membrane protein
LKPSERPAIDIPHTSQEVALEAIAIGGIFLVTVMVVLFWSSLPALIPSHFGVSGTVDAWGDKRTILIFPGVGLVLYVLLTVVRRYPHNFNYAWPITEQNVQEQYQLACSLLTWLKMEIMLLFAYLEWMTIQTALQQTAGLGFFFLPLVLVIIFGTIGVYFYQAYLAR